MITTRGEDGQVQFRWKKSGGGGERKRKWATKERKGWTAREK